MRIRKAQDRSSRSWAGIEVELPRAEIVLASLILEAMVGYPTALHARVPHPVVWAGSMLQTLEMLWNRPQDAASRRRVLGCATVVLVIACAVAIGLGIEVWARTFSSGWLLVAVVGTLGIAQRSLFEHVRSVLSTLGQQDLPMARERVAHIVGRDTSRLDEPGVSAAALESLAESFNDGVLAPAFWFLVGGLPALFAYKALNTADSLIGHKEERWRAFGWAAARADDVANLIPARIAGLLIAIAGRGGFRVMLRDASKHDSPNAGWPEAAMAGALGVRLGGVATYDGIVHERPIFGDGSAPRAKDLARGLRVYLAACAWMWAIVLAVAIASRFGR